MGILSLLSQQTMALIQLGSVSTLQQVSIDQVLLRIRYQVEYPNGYAASIVKNVYTNGASMSYGSGEDLWEFAVLRGGKLCYDTPITDDVIGYLAEDDIVALAKEVKELPSADTAEDFSCLFSGIICLW